MAYIFSISFPRINAISCAFTFWNISQAVYEIMQNDNIKELNEKNINKLKNHHQTLECCV